MGGASGRKRLRRRVLPWLSPEEGRQTLQRLLGLHPDLEVEVEMIARSVLADVTFESVADGIQVALGSGAIDEVHARSGPGKLGYVEPTEAAWAILEERLQPFLGDIERRVKLGLEDQALAVCQGVMLGLYRLEQEGEDEIWQWAPDFAVEAAGQAMETWRTGSRTGRGGTRAGRRGRPAFPQDFVHRVLPEWEEMLAGVTTRGR